MGERLIEEYKKAFAIGGLKAQMRLAVLTKMPDRKAKEAPDSSENIALFQEAMNEISKEFQK